MRDEYCCSDCETCNEDDFDPDCFCTGPRDRRDIRRETWCIVIPRNVQECEEEVNGTVVTVAKEKIRKFYVPLSKARRPKSARRLENSVDDLVCVSQGNDGCSLIKDYCCNHANGECVRCDGFEEEAGCFCHHRDDRDCVIVPSEKRDGCDPEVVCVRHGKDGCSLGKEFCCNFAKDECVVCDGLEENGCFCADGNEYCVIVPAEKREQCDPGKSL